MPEKYKTSARQVDKHPTLYTAPARSVIKKGARPRSRPGPRPGPAQRARHTNLGSEASIRDRSKAKTGKQSKASKAKQRQAK